MLGFGLGLSHAALMGGPSWEMRVAAIGVDALLNFSDLTSLYAALDGTGANTVADGVIGNATDKSGNGNDFVAANDVARAILRASPYRAESDNVDDNLQATFTLTSGYLTYGTPYGYIVTPGVNFASLNLPLSHTTRAVISESLTAGELATVENFLDEGVGKGEKYLIGVSTDSTQYHSITSTNGPYTIRFVGANSVVYETAADETTDLAAQGLTAPYAVIFPLALKSDTALVNFYVNSNQLTGSIPSLTANTALVTFYAYSNQLTGSIPSLTANTALANFRVDSNQLTGSIPSLTANTALVNFYVNSNQLTGFLGSVSSTLETFRAENNLLTQANIDDILAAFVAAGRTSTDGTVVLDVGGTGNATPSAAGLTDKTTLQGRGWTVTTN